MTARRVACGVAQAGWGVWVAGEWLGREGRCHMAAAATAMRKRIAHARERKRLRCDSSTTYRHDSLVEYVRGALPDDWSVVGPGAPVEGPEPPAAPSQYPPSAGEESQAALRAFLLAPCIAVCASVSQP